MSILQLVASSLMLHAAPEGDACRTSLERLHSPRTAELAAARAPEYHRLGVKMKQEAGLILDADFGSRRTTLKTTAHPRVFASTYAAPDGRAITLYYLRDSMRVGYVIEAKGSKSHVCGLGVAKL